ncbi:iron-sulfur cofactor synthesis [Gracilibacillus halophilus YIM-C55.5]|uniref:cysteine desulfurase n=1 Tax=Gracilibacillus halophilus YIM-C55.5 TaxID=1308866 RepID=N4W9Y3_9BACI|nr:cysteine desulfurase family protein [Gracilibacillus halophilus]ENH97078.1 iron-sulfur cofactor synthesis [Gracilibacillus halophilus YIM-C55.5]
MEAIYLDHAATTPMHPKVIEAMTTVMQDTFGNPSSIHGFGRQARKLLDQARRVAAQSINANEKAITFTSGGTEADNLALLGVAYANQDKGKHIITTKMEHHATLHTAEHLEKQGFSVTYLDVDDAGHIQLDQFDEALTDQTILVSVMMVNNETGVIQPVEEIGERLANHQAYFHSDAVQGFGMIPIDVEQMQIDLLTVSSHKINGPKGIGFLYAGTEVILDPRQHGGEQERKRRPGTENVAGIVGFQQAIELVNEHRYENYETYANYRKQFLNTLEDEGVDFTVNGDLQKTVPTIVNISFPGANVEAMLTNFDLSGVAASSGSACTAGSVEPSHVLCAMFGEDHPSTTNSIRFSFGLANTDENVTKAAQKVAAIIHRLTSM